MSEPAYMDAKQLRPGPIHHKSLSRERLEQINAVFDVIGSYLDTNLEKFQLNFMRDLYTESEVNGIGLAFWRSETRNAVWAENPAMQNQSKTNA